MLTRLVIASTIAACAVVAPAAASASAAPKADIATAVPGGQHSTKQMCKKRLMMDMKWHMKCYWVPF